MCIDSLAIKWTIEDATIKPNQAFLLYGFGIGLSWGTILLKTGVALR